MADMTIAQVALGLGRTRQTILAWRKTRSLPCRMIAGRPMFEPDAVLSWAEREGEDVFRPDVFRAAGATRIPDPPKIEGLRRRRNSLGSGV